MFDNRNNNEFDISSLARKINPFANATKEELIRSMDRMKKIVDSINIIVGERKIIRDTVELNYQEEYERLEVALRKGTVTQNDKDFLVLFKASLDRAEIDFCAALDQKFKFESIMKQLEDAMKQKMNSPGQEGMRN